MKKRQEIKDLNALAPKVEWPRHNHKFEAFRSKLKEVIAANFDHPVVNTLEYGEDEGLFYITLSYGSTLGGPWSENLDDSDRRTGFKLERLIQIDPQLPLTIQINDALDAHEDLKDRHRLIQLLLNEHLGQE
jgi:hypothetical protein